MNEEPDMIAEPVLKTYPRSIHVRHRLPEHENTSALVILDMQNDYCPGGILAVSEADSIIPVLNKYIDIFTFKRRPVFASRDWHPEVTRHFKKYGGNWPSHCIRNSRGADYHSALRLPASAMIISKGLKPETDGDSVFQGEDEHGMDFSTLLLRLKIRELYIGGVAAEYCVRHSALDALRLGFKVKLLIDAVRGFNVNENGTLHTLSELFHNGSQGVTWNAVA